MAGEYGLDGLAVQTRQSGFVKTLKRMPPPFARRFSAWHDQQIQ
jgi:hypothetical protein